MIKVLERDGFGSQSLVVPICSHLRAHITSLTKELAAAIGVDFESLLDANGFPLAEELERGVADSKVIAVVRACLRGLKAGYEKALQKQFRMPGQETVFVAALLNPAVARECFAAGEFEAAVQTLRSLYDRAARGAGVRPTRAMGSPVRPPGPAEGPRSGLSRLASPGPAQHVPAADELAKYISTHCGRMGQTVVGDEIMQEIMVARVGNLAGLWAGVEGAYMNPATFPLAAFWEAQQADYPVLAHLAIARLSAPVSTASVERFSNARLVLTDRRKGRLSDQTLEDLMMIGGNRKLAKEVRRARRAIP